ncbi:hypothetical protein [Pseudomonas sp. NPDC089406]|uniref:hypothetical protein n=1 Tax=Pseudomonas sp. NPDC089406 TaxID=3364463 RepID=UPI00384D8631
MFNDFTDFENGQWNGWVPEADRKLSIVSTPRGYHLELPRQAVVGPQKLVSKTMSGLRPGKRYLARLQVRERDDVGSGTQQIGFAIDGGEVTQWHLVQGHGWQKYSLAFTATREAHEVSLCFEHMPGEGGGEAGGDFCLDDLRLTTYGDGDGDDFIDFTDFEHATDPLNGWVRDAHGQSLSVLRAADGSHYLGHAAPLQSGAMGPVLSKAINWSGRFRRCSFSLRARKAGFAFGSDPQITLQYDGQDLAGQPIDSDEWSTFEWKFEASAIGNVSVQVFEQVAVAADEAAGLWIDDLLVSELFFERTNFEGATPEQQFNGWSVMSYAAYANVKITLDGIQELHVLDCPLSIPGLREGDPLLVKQYRGLLEGARFEFIMRVRRTSDLDPPRLSLTCNGETIMAQTPILNTDWPLPFPLEQLYKGQFTAGKETAWLRVHNHKASTYGNAFRISELIVRRIDLDEK